MKFARLFDYKTGQLLLSITLNSDLNGMLLNIETFHQGTFIKTGLPFTELEAARAALEGFSDQQAEELYGHLIKAVSEPKRAATSGILNGFETWLTNAQN